MFRGITKIRQASSLQVFLHTVKLSSKDMPGPIAIDNPQNLPLLPVPKLDDTLKKFLRSVKPFLAEDEFSRTSSVVSKFAENEGKKLQDLLQQKAANSLNWLEEWWINVAYLEYRDPVCVYSSPGLVYPLRDFRNESEQLEYAAKTILAAIAYKNIIYNNKLPTEMMGKAQLDMLQYKKIFGTCRVPSEKRDSITFNPNSKHITVFHKNHIFHLDIYGEDGVVLNLKQMKKQLKKVIEMSYSRTNDAIGILTSDNRDNWTKAYKVLCKDRMNKEYLTDIQKSLFILSLDEKSGLKRFKDPNMQMTLAGLQTIHGCGSCNNGGNRWFDKTVQFIVGADGVVGLTYEHTPAEGQPIAVMTDFIVNYIGGETRNDSPSAKPIEPVHLRFNITEEIREHINLAAKNLDSLMNNFELDCFKFKDYGKNFIKTQKLSPDSYLQMAMQFAFYRLHKEPAAHYESAATRMFVGGRTETIRSCSIESVDFAQTMLNSKATDEQKITALRKAIKGHKDYTVQALQGLGVDRHLLGLKMIALENDIPLPKLYKDPAYLRSTHMKISTSQVACKADGGMCYGPLVPNGYSTCYNPRDDDINLAVGSFVNNPESNGKEYKQALEQSLIDMRDLLARNVKAKAKL